MLRVLDRLVGEPEANFGKGRDSVVDYQPMASSGQVGLEGKKADSGKDRWDLAPMDAIREVVKVLGFGASKYGDRNWEKGIKFSRLYAAALRHLTAWFEGEDRDPETGLSHLAHAGCCVLFLLAFTIRGHGHFDDRPKTVAQTVTSTYPYNIPADYYGVYQNPEGLNTTLLQSNHSGPPNCS